MANTRELSQLASVITVADETTNVGIGTTNPTSKLHVAGNITATSFFGDGSALTGIVASGSGVVIRDDGSLVGTATTIDFGANLSVSFASGIATITASGGGGSQTLNTTLGLGNTSSLGMSVGVVTATSFNGDGSALTGLSVGVGTTASINTTGIITATSFSGDGSALTGLSGGSSSQFVTTAAGIHTLSNVGIGTTNPTSKLHVIGDVRVTGIITATTFVGALTGTATSTTNIPNLTGAITSVNTTTSLGSFTSLQLLTALTDETGSGANVFATSPTLTTPALGTPSSGTLTSCTGLPLSTGVTGTLPVANGGTGVTASTGTGSVVLSTSPTLVTPLLGTPTSGNLANCTFPTLNQNTTGTAGTATRVESTVTGTTSVELVRGNMADNDHFRILVSGTAGNAGFAEIATADDGTEPIHVRQYTGVFSSLARTATLLDGSGNTSFPNSVTATTFVGALTGTASNVTTNANLTGHVTSVGNAAVLGSFTSLQLLTALTDETGSGSAVFATSPTLVTPALGTPQSGTLTSCTGLPISTGVADLAANVATFLATPSSANLAAALTDETGSGANVFATSPTLVTPALGTPSSGTLTSCTGLPITGITSSTTIGLGVGSIELGHATDTTLARSAAGVVTIEGVEVVTLSRTQTLTNKTLTSPTLTTPVLGTPSSGTLSGCTVDGTDAVGFRNIPQNSQSGAYTLVLADNGKHIFHPVGDNNARTFTIPANSSVAYPIGTTLTFINMAAAAVTIAITTDTLTLSSAGTAGSRTLAQYGSATCIKITSTSWIISGSGLT